MSRTGPNDSFEVRPFNVSGSTLRDREGSTHRTPFANLRGSELKKSTFSPYFVGSRMDAPAIFTPSAIQCRVNDVRRVDVTHTEITVLRTFKVVTLGHRLQTRTGSPSRNRGWVPPCPLYSLPRLTPSPWVWVTHTVSRDPLPSRASFLRVSTLCLSKGSGRFYETEGSRSSR